MDTAIQRAPQVTVASVDGHVSDSHKARPISPSNALSPNLDEHVEAAEPTMSRPFWQMEPCPVWCQDKHRDRDYYEDRNHSWCATAELELALYQEEYSPGEYGSSTMTVAVNQHYRAAAPEIELVVPTPEKGHPYVASGEVGVRMTVGEARGLRDCLTEVILLLETPT